MSVGLIALLDDVATIAKTAAASLDDVAGQAAKAGAKSAGIVIDDTAVTPRYVIGFAADRELPIVYRIARGSLRNKLLFLLPGALALSFLAPWALTPLLMIGGAYLCYEGAEKVWEAYAPHEAHGHEEKLTPEVADPKALEDLRVAGAIKTDFILSAEIMALTLAIVAESSLLTQIVVMALVGTVLTLGVYGAVALIVRADDFGVRLAASDRGALVRSFGRGLVKGMPWFLRALAILGTAAMIWVGGGIVLHGLTEFGLGGPEHAIEGLAHAAGGLGWLATIVADGLFGLALGAALIPLVGKVLAPLWRAVAARTSKAVAGA